MQGNHFKYHGLWISGGRKTTVVGGVTWHIVMKNRVSPLKKFWPCGQKGYPRIHGGITRNWALWACPRQQASRAGSCWLPWRTHPLLAGPQSENRWGSNLLQRRPTGSSARKPWGGCPSSEWYLQQGLWGNRDPEGVHGHLLFLSWSRGRQWQRPRQRPAQGIPSSQAQGSLFDPQPKRFCMISAMRTKNVMVSFSWSWALFQVTCRPSHICPIPPIKSSLFLLTNTIPFLYRKYIIKYVCQSYKHHGFNKYWKIIMPTGAIYLPFQCHWISLTVSI